MKRLSINHKAAAIILVGAFFLFLLNLDELLGVAIQSLLK